MQRSQDVVAKVRVVAREPFGDLVDQIPNPKARLSRPRQHFQRRPAIPMYCHPRVTMTLL